MIEDPRTLPDDHVMLDLETTDTAPTAAILAIGAVCFAGPNTGAEFYLNVDYISCMEKARSTSSQSTLEWWGRQSDAARNALTYPTPVDVDVALAEFAAFLAPLSRPRVWGNGAAFDQPVLSGTYLRRGVRLPWDFRHDRCYRTVMAILGDPPYTYDGTAHHALCDAYNQAGRLLTHMGHIA